MTPPQPGSGVRSDGGAVLVGEIRTGLLQNSSKLTGATAGDLLALLPGARVRTSTRPIVHALSPDLAYGVYCPLAHSSGSRVEGIGTVLARASLTGGRVLQASARSLLTRTVVDHRLPWSHYVARLGTVEYFGKTEPINLATGFLRNGSRTTLDPGAVCARILDRVQRSPLLDRSAPFRARRTRLKFAVAWVSEEQHSVDPHLRATSRNPGITGHTTFVIDDDSVRTLQLRLPVGDPLDVVTLCEDLALHDWLLTTALRFLESSEVGSDLDRGSILRLGPVITHLLPLWMPGARVPDDLLPVWHALERRPGFSRQWDSLLAHIRDRMSLSVVASLNASSIRD